MYSSVETRRDVQLFLAGWFFLGLLAAFYCLYQEFAGLPSYDYAYVTKDEGDLQIVFYLGSFKKILIFL